MGNYPTLSHIGATYNFMSSELSIKISDFSRIFVLFGDLESSQYIDGSRNADHTRYQSEV